MGGRSAPGSSPLAPWGPATFWVAEKKKGFYGEVSHGIFIMGMQSVSEGRWFHSERKRCYCLLGLRSQVHGFK